MIAKKKTSFTICIVVSFQPAIFALFFLYGLRFSMCLTVLLGLRKEIIQPPFVPLSLAIMYLVLVQVILTSEEPLVISKSILKKEFTNLISIDQTTNYYPKINLKGFVEGVLW